MNGALISGLISAVISLVATFVMTLIIPTYDRTRALMPSRSRASSPAFSRTGLR